MKHKLALLLITILLSSCSVVSYIACPNPNGPWNTCKRDSDCLSHRSDNSCIKPTAFHYGCTKYINDLDKKLQKSISCEKSYVPRNLKAKCVKSKCVLKKI